jgi:DNA-binding protein H-NS
MVSSQDRIPRLPTGRIRPDVSPGILGVVYILADRLGRLRRLPMARPKSLAKLSLETLIQLRDSITSTLSEQAADMQKRLANLTGTGAGNGVRRGRPPGRKRGSKLKGRKVAAKYRSRKNPKLTWAGRGATPRWMRDEMKAGKLKKDAFLIK